MLGSAIENASHAAMMPAMPDMQHSDPNASRIAPGKSARLLWGIQQGRRVRVRLPYSGHYEAGMKGEAVVD